jgi:hypothetical protein
MCLIRDQKKRWGTSPCSFSDIGIDELLGDKFLRGEDDERFVGISVDEIGSLIEQTLGFGRMSGGEGLGKEVIETLAKVWNSSLELLCMARDLWRCQCISVIACL